MFATSLALIALTILFTVYGQVVVKWQVSRLGPFPAEASARAGYFVALLLSPWIISGLLAGLLAALCWMAAVSRVDLSYAYPFVSLTYPSVLLLAALLFGEPITWSKALGMMLILTGIAIHSRG